MGPRPFSRGYGHIFLEPEDPEYMFQWGHDLSAVDTWRGRAEPAPVDGFQWGHDLSAVDTPTIPEIWDILRRVSMGPRPFSRGYNPLFGELMNAIYTVSMGPRPFSRGYASSNGATTFQPWIRIYMSLDPDVRFQWGHDLSAVDTAVERRISD